MTQRKLFNKRDIWFLAGLVLLALFAYVWRGSAALYGERFAQVSSGGQVVWRAPLSAPGQATFTLEQANVQLLVSDGSAGFVSSDCPDQICVRSGFISQPGQIAVCVPNRTSLLIVGERHRQDSGVPDTFAY